MFWIDSHQKRYVAAVGDFIIGHVMSKIGVDFFRVDIGAAQVTSCRTVTFYLPAVTEGQTF